MQAKKAALGRLSSFLGWNAVLNTPTVRIKRSVIPEQKRFN
jgi:hypothetical protein